MDIGKLIDKAVFSGDQATMDNRLREMLTVEYAQELYEEGTIK